MKNIVVGMITIIGQNITKENRFNCGNLPQFMRLWCNGSTVAFQAISEGSNPSNRSNI